MGGRGSKINSPWNREGGEGHIVCKSYCVCVCVRGGGNVRRERKREKKKYTFGYFLSN